MNESSYLIEISQNATSRFSFAFYVHINFGKQVNIEDVITNPIVHLVNILHLKRNFHRRATDLRDNLNFKTRQGLI